MFHICKFLPQNRLLPENDYDSSVELHTDSVFISHKSKMNVKTKFLERYVESYDIIRKKKSIVNERSN